MLKLKTNKEFNVPKDRGTVNVIVRLIVENVFFDKNNVKVNGYYYYLDAENKAIILDKFGTATLVLRENLNALEDNLLPELKSKKRTFDNLEQRIEELTRAQIDSEYPQNWGIKSLDLVYDIDEIIEPEI